MRHHFLRRFLLAFGGSALLVMVAGWALIFRGVYWLPLNQSSTLVEFQQHKLETARDCEVIFVGDSSLGYSIDSAEFSRLSGKRCLNLALNGYFGLEGSYEMIQHALEKQPVKKVVIMQTVDMLTRERRSQALVYAAHSPASFLSSDWKELSENLSALANIFFSGEIAMQSLTALFEPAKPKLSFVDDYVAQGRPLTAAAAEKDDLDGDVQAERVRWLQRIVSLCRAKNVDVFYVHGPLYDDTIGENPDRIRRINDAIRAAGVESDFALEPIPFEDLGNSIDHVRPSAEDNYTIKYFRRLRDWLSRP